MPDVCHHDAHGIVSLARELDRSGARATISCLTADRRRPRLASLFLTEPHCNAGSGMSGPLMKVGASSAKTWDCFIFDSNSHKHIGITMTRTANFTESKSQSPVLQQFALGFLRKPTEPTEPPLVPVHGVSGYIRHRC